MLSGRLSRASVQAVWSCAAGSSVWLCSVHGEAEEKAVLPLVLSEQRSDVLKCLNLCLGGSSWSSVFLGRRGVCLGARPQVARVCNVGIEAGAEWKWKATGCKYGEGGPPPASRGS